MIVVSLDDSFPFFQTWSFKKTTLRDLLIDLNFCSFSQFKVAPPPPEFSDIVSNTRSLHIPTQQSQQYRQYASVNYMQQNQQKGVRIVGALPKHNNMPGQSASGKIVRTNHPHHHIHHYHHQHHY